MCADWILESLDSPSYSSLFMHDETDPQRNIVDDRVAWELPVPFDLVSLHDDRSWEALEQRYSREPGRIVRWTEVPKGTDRPLHRCLEVARQCEAKTAVIETRYIDQDYRSEYSAFYSKAFASLPDSTHRVHFFGAALTAELLWRLPKEHNYLGYLVIRPSVPGVVGRTMLHPPPSLRHAVRTAVTEIVTFFGQSLTITAAPFIQQDERLGKCAHAACWMCHYSASHNGTVARRSMADFSLLADPSLAVGRPIPSPGLTLHQISELLRSFGLPAVYYSINGLTASDRPPMRPERAGEESTRLPRVCCRYLNSGFPLLVIVKPSVRSGDYHSLVLCGYSRSSTPDAAQRNRLTVALVVHDDQRGPYLNVKDWQNDIDSLTSVRYLWEQLLVPLPEKLWLTGEAAERKGSEILFAAAETGARIGIKEAARLTNAFEAGRLTFRTYAISGNQFKTGLVQRFSDPIILREYAFARLPRFIWVVEAVDRQEREGNRACVLGEIILDATSDDREPQILATRIPGVLAIPRPDNPKYARKTGADPVRSGGVWDP